MSKPVATGSLSELAQRQPNGVCDGVEYADGGVHSALLDLNQHAPRNAAALCEAVECQPGGLSRLGDGMTERRKVHWRGRLDHNFQASRHKSRCQCKIMP